MEQVDNMFFNRELIYAKNNNEWNPFLNKPIFELFSFRQNFKPANSTFSQMDSISSTVRIDKNDYRETR